MEFEPIFLGIERIARLHQSLIETYGGEQGVRDIGLLESAIANFFRGLAK